MTGHAIRLSLLDQSPRGGDQSVASALEASLRRAEAAEHAGFQRVWFAEHHGHAAFVGDEPLTLAAAALERTDRVRVGSGGVLVAYHPPAETARALRHLALSHPGRLDAGLARAGAGRAAFAAGVDAVAAGLDGLGGQIPPLWLLGVGSAAAEHATALGAGFAFGHFFVPEAAAASFAARPPGSANLLAVRLVVRPTDEEACRAAETFAGWRARRDLGFNEPLPRHDDDRLPTGGAGPVSLDAVVHGTAATAAQRLVRLAAGLRVDEVMVTLPDTDVERSIETIGAVAHAVRRLGEPVRTG